MSALQNPQIGTTGITLSTNASQQLYIAPFIAQMVANAEGTVGVLQRAAVTITGVDETFNLVLSEAESVKLLNAFHVYKTDAHNDGIDGVLDTSAGVTVDIISSNEATFKAALRTALDAAMSDNQHYSVGQAGSGAAGDENERTITEYLKRETYVDTRDQLAYDTLANLLEASDLASFTMQLDVSGAAKNMYEQLNGVGPLPARYRRTIFTQLPEENTEAYLLPKSTGDLSGNATAEAITDIKFLPFLSGDKIYFVFDAVVGAASVDGNGMLSTPSSGATIGRDIKDADYADKVQVGSAGMAGLASLAKDNAQNPNDSEYASAADSVFFSAPTKRRIGVSVQVAKGVALPPVKAPFNIELAAGVIVDPSGAHYEYVVASGLLSDAAELKLSSDAPSGTHAMIMPAAPMAAAVDLSGVNLSNLGHATAELIATLPDVQNAGGVKGKWLIVNAAGNKNQFVLNGSKVEYRARIATAAADSASLYYVSNVGKSGPVALSGGASYSTIA
jgi:hypothetical protein